MQGLVTPIAFILLASPMSAAEVDFFASGAKRVTILRTRFSLNEAPRGGGAFFRDFLQVTVRDGSAFVENKCSRAWFINERRAHFPGGWRRNIFSNQ